MFTGVSYTSPGVLSLMHVTLHSCTTLYMVFSVTYYLELSSVITFCIVCKFLKVISVMN